MDRTCRERAGRNSLAFSIPATSPIKIRPRRLREALTLTGSAQVDAYLGVFLTETDRAPRKSVVTKKFTDNNPAIGRLFESEALRLMPLIERRRAVTARDRTEALLAYRNRRRGKLPAREAGTRPARL